MNALFALLWALRKVLSLNYGFGTMEPAGEHIYFSWFTLTRADYGSILVRWEHETSFAFMLRSVVRLIEYLAKHDKSYWIWKVCDVLPYGFHIALRAYWDFE